MDPISLQMEEQSNSSVALPPSPAIQVQVWHDRHAGMCKEVKCLGLWVFCVTTIIFSHQLTLLPLDSLLAAQGRLDSLEQPHGLCSSTGAVLPGRWGETRDEPSPWHIHHDSITHWFSRQCSWKVFLLASFWLLITTWLVLPPQPNYRATLWIRSGNQFSATHF